MRRRFSTVFAVMFALTLAVPAVAQRNRDRDRDRDWDQDRDRGPRETETVDRTLSLPPGGTVRLKTFSGRVNITGTSGNQVVIKAVRRATRERLQDIKLEITQNGNDIDIDANHRLVERRNDNVVETDFDIQVPNQATLDLRTFSAPVTVDGVAGDLAVDGFSSEVRLTEVSGPTRIKTFSGGVHVQARAWTEGDNVNISTFSGDVTLRLPDNARGDLTFDTFSGHFNSDLPVTLSSSSKRNFRGALNGGGATDLRLKTFSGDVNIRR
jgi:lia operon protein LiaG